MRLSIFSTICTFPIFLRAKWENNFSRQKVWPKSLFRVLIKCDGWFRHSISFFIIMLSNFYLKKKIEIKWIWNMIILIIRPAIHLVTSDHQYKAKKTVSFSIKLQTEDFLTDYLQTFRQTNILVIYVFMYMLILAQSWFLPWQAQLQQIAPGGQWLCSDFLDFGAPCWSTVALHGGTGPLRGLQLLPANSSAEPWKENIRIRSIWSLKIFFQKWHLKCLPFLCPFGLLCLSRSTHPC